MCDLYKHIGLLGTSALLQGRYLSIFLAMSSGRQEQLTEANMWEAPLDLRDRLPMG